jgi:Spy/CpxP family protein refolding chaperone
MRMIVALCLSLGALAGSTALNVYQAKSASAPAAPCPMRDMTGPAQGRPCQPLAVRVGLTADQKKCFVSSCPAYTEQRAQLQKKIDALVGELEKELSAENPDAERIDGIADEIGKARAEELKSCIKNMLLVRKTLTPDQLKRLAECCGRQ